MYQVGPEGQKPIKARRGKVQLRYAAIGLRVWLYDNVPEQLVRAVMQMILNGARCDVFALSMISQILRSASDV